MLNGRVCDCRDCCRARRRGYILGSRRLRFDRSGRSVSQYIRLPDYRNKKEEIE